MFVSQQATIMDTPQRITLTAETEINAPIEKVWELWNNPADIMQWNIPNVDWHTPKVENDLRPGGRFRYVMGLKDGSFTFNFEGTYDEVKLHELISYTLGDGRKSTITFTTGSPVKLTESFEPDGNEPPETQMEFCKAVLEKFARYTEGSSDCTKDLNIDA